MHTRSLIVRPCSTAALVAFVALLSAGCGSGSGASSSTSPPSAASPTGSSIAPSPGDRAPPGSRTSSPSYGEVFATVTTSMIVNGQPGYLLGAHLTAPTATLDLCANAKS